MKLRYKVAFTKQSYMKGLNKSLMPSRVVLANSFCDHLRTYRRTSYLLRLPKNRHI